VLSALEQLVATRRAPLAPCCVSPGGVRGQGSCSPPTATLHTCCRAEGVFQKRLYDAASSALRCSWLHCEGDTCEAKPEQLPKRPRLVLEDAPASYPTRLCVALPPPWPMDGCRGPARLRAWPLRRRHTLGRIAAERAARLVELLERLPAGARGAAARACALLLLARWARLLLHSALRAPQRSSRAHSAGGRVRGSRMLRLRPGASHACGSDCSLQGKMFPHPMKHVPACTMQARRRRLRGWALRPATPAPCRQHHGGGRWRSAAGAAAPRVRRRAGRGRGGRGRAAAPAVRRRPLLGLRGRWCAPRVPTRSRATLCMPSSGVQALRQGLGAALPVACARGAGSLRETASAVLMACGSLERPADPRSSSSFIEGCALAARAQPSAATRGRARARRWRARCRPCGRVWRAARRSVVNTARGREEGARAGPARELLGGAAGAPPAGPAMPSRALASCSRPRRCESRRAPPRRVG
jgi:hypothetical protein